MRGFASFGESAPKRLPGLMTLGREMVAYQVRKYQVARMGYDAAREIIETGESYDGMPRSEAARHQEDLPELMARCDHQWRNNGLFSGLITRAVDNIVGKGIHVLPQTGDRELNRALELEFHEYMSDSDAYGPDGMNGYQAQRVALLDVFRGGNNLHYESDAGWQSFEPAQVGTPLGYSTDLRRIQQGVEIGETGRVSRYWVGPFAAWGYVDMSQAVGLRADRCLLIGNREYASGHRSVPPLGNVVERFVHADKFIETYLVGARMASSIVATVTSPDKKILNAFATALTNGTVAKGQEDNLPPLSKRVRMAPASIIPLLGDEKFDFKSPGLQHTEFAAYIRFMMRICGIKIGMPLEIGILDFSETNFSSSKMLAAQAMLTWGQYQELVMGPLVRRQYSTWFRKTRKTAIPKSGTDVARFEIKFPKPAWIDSLKEAMARREGVDSGWLSNTSVASEMGRVIEDVIQERAAEVKAAIEAVTKIYTPGSEEWKMCVQHTIGNAGDFREALAKGGFLKAKEAGEEI